ncbi:MAG TPA: glycosyltransferase family 39 protein [Thermoleophilaceae bacterium]|nr:glycosyltransferase family 39 protein [Thermoleophilaceae bacterium]
MPYRLLLAVPFLIGIAVLQGLTVEIDTFHGTDARVYQLPTIMQLSERFDLSDYPSAQTPLYHLVTAAWGELVGFELWKLRLLNVAISYGMALALMRLLRRATPLGDLPAFALTLAFVLSPYVFGASFTLLTDNLAILFALVALERIHAYARGGSLAAFAVACVAIGAAVMTRQSALWLVPVAAFFLVRPPLRPLPVAAGAAFLGLSLIPLAALVIEWNGLVPPSADPASCGLCTDRPGVGRDSLTLRTVGFSVALLGMYAALVLGPAAWRRLRRLRSPVTRAALGAARVPIARSALAAAGVRARASVALLAAGVAVGVAVVLISPLEYQPPQPGVQGDAGYLWRLSDELPTVLGTSLLLWLLVPLGAVAAALLARRAGWTSLSAVYLGAFLLGTLPVNLVYQKYFDPFMLLAVALFARPGDLRRPSDYAGVAVICAASVAYALSFAG